MSQRHFAAALVLLLAVAAAVRALVLGEFWQENPFALFPWADGDLYWRRAGEMAAGSWAEPTPFLIAPLYPYLLGVLRWLGGEMAVLQALQIGLHLATAAFLADATRRRFDERAGLLAALLFLLLAEPALFATRVLSATLQVFLVTLLWWDAVRLAEAPEPSRTHAARTGLWLGLFALSFPAAVLLLPLLGGWLLWRFRQPLPALLGVGAALLAIAPATLHNAWRSGEWIPITAHGGVTLAQGNSAASVGIYTKLPDVGHKIERQHTDAARAFELANGRAGGWGEIDAFFRARAVDWWLDEPGDAALLLLSKLRWFASSHRYDNVAAFALEREHGLLGTAVLVPLAVPWLLGLTLLGLGLAWRNGDRGLPELALLGLPLLVCMVFYYSARYRLVGVPVACGLAAVALVHWRELPLPRMALLAIAILPLPLLAWNTAVGFEDLDFMRHDFARALSSRHARAGVFHQEAGDPARALRHYREALAADAANAGAHRRIYNLHVAADEIDAAAAALEAFVTAVPEDGQARLALAWLRATARDPGLRSADEALRHARAALRLLGPERPEGQLVLALAEAAAGRFEAAGTALDRARELAQQAGDTALLADLEELAGHIERQRAVHTAPRPLRVATR